MQTPFKNPIKFLAPVFLVVVAIFVFGFGCNTSKPIPDPLAGWKLCQSQDPKYLDQAIRDDYQGYIQTLSPEERRSAGPIHLFEDEMGQHAVKIDIGVNGTSWEHVLIYDKDNKRIKTIKYAIGHYAS